MCKFAAQLFHKILYASHIELLEGLEVEEGASFEASIYECNMVNH